ncbi:Tctex1 domain-containing protein 3 [Rhizophlyctis rosea]|nr:Tctex1 domain-containing protein 3 [Rhizophlyctis rosea]
MADDDAPGTPPAEDASPPSAPTSHPGTAHGERPTTQPIPPTTPGGSTLANQAAGLRGSRNLLGSRNNLATLSRGPSLRNISTRGGGAGAAGGGGGGGGGGGDGSEAPANAIVFENTYKLKPDKKFQTENVKKLTGEILAKNLTKVKYDPDKVTDLSKRISDEILAAVKKLEFDRYKLVVEVTIGEFKGQGIRVASRAVWDTTTDSYASAHFKNATLFAVAIVFGCFYE